jgi:hypothetical protein
MTAQSKPAKNHDTTSDLVQTAHAEFLAALEQAIEATRQVQHAPPLVPSAPGSEHPAQGPTELPPQRGPRATAPGASAELRRDHDARQPDPFVETPLDQRRHGGPSTSLPLQVRVPIDRSPRPRMPGERRPLDRISSAARPVSSEQQRQREAVIEQLRQRRAEPSDLSQRPESRRWLGIASVTRLAIVGAIAVVVGFAVYELVSIGPQWTSLFAKADDPAHFSPNRPSLLTDLSGAAKEATPPDSVTSKSVKTATITSDAGSSIAWPDPPMPSNRAMPSNVVPTGNAEPVANAMRTASAEPAANIGPTGESAAVASRQLDSDELGKLLKRSETFLNNGDIAAAQLLLRRAAEAGDARAAVALAATYDPLVLKQLGAVGAKDDIAQARAWYQRASQLGSTEAGTRLQELAREAR